MFRKSSNNPFISGGFLNFAYDTVQGGGPETVGTRYPGLLGQTFVANDADALKVSKTSVATLFEGVYQYVKFTTAVTIGTLLFWDTLANNGLHDFEVTNTASAAGCFRAGICLLTDASATGKFGWIQVAGLANVQYANSAVGAIGNAVIQATALDTPLLTVNTVNNFQDATQIGTLGVGTLEKSWVGIAYETPSQNNIRRVLLNLRGFYPNVG